MVEPRFRQLGEECEMLASQMPVGLVMGPPNQSQVEGPTVVEGAPGRFILEVQHHLSNGKNNIVLL